MHVCVCVFLSSRWEGGCGGAAFGMLSFGGFCFLDKRLHSKETDSEQS